MKHGVKCYNDGVVQAVNDNVCLSHLLMNFLLVCIGKCDSRDITFKHNSSLMHHKCNFFNTIHATSKHYIVSNNFSHEIFSYKYTANYYYAYYRQIQIVLQCQCLDSRLTWISNVR